MELSTNYSCVECNEVISNPLCSDCLAKKMRFLVKLHNPLLAEKINGPKIYGETVCISCGSKMGLCPCCFSKEIYKLIKLEQPSLAEEFSHRFDFE